MSMQTKNSIFLVCSKIIKHFQGLASYFTFFSHNVDDPVLKGLCKFQANKLVNAWVTTVQSLENHQIIILQQPWW